MLYLTRKKNEAIIVNNTIEIKVVEISGNKVKLGFTFPEGSTILRSELHQKIISENEVAFEFDIDDFSVDDNDNRENSTEKK